MVLTSDRDHGSRNTRIRKSIDGYAAAAFSSTRKRTSFPSATSKSAESDTLESASHSHSGSSIDGSPSPSITKPTKNTTSIMSSFFSRFGSRNRSRPTLVPDVVESPPTKHHRYSRHSSIPSTPSPQNRTSSVSIVDPLPLNAFRTIEQFPLCVAKVTAIKTTLLPACTLSSEKILRQEAEKGSKRGRATHRHHVSTKSADLDWTKKLFVLVPGILLQYSGDGLEDRLPEKVLQLTANSLAFASDAIPGRPWVLQVYRSAGEDGSGALVTDRRNAFIAKVTFRGGMKNSASALLLVFEGADDMDSWMGLLRAEAARLGGKKPKPPPKPPRKSLELEKEAEDTEKEQPEDETEKEESENSRFSRRIVINREDSNAKNEWSSSDENASKRASTYRTSTDAERSITSNDQIVLDQLRGSRLSLHSGGDKTRVMTVSGSPDTSPERHSAKSGDTSYKRQSLALSTKSQSSVELRPAPPPLGLSAIDQDGKLYWIPRTPSPSATTATTTTNNFSLPTYRQTRTVSVPVVPPMTAAPSITEANEAAQQQRRPRPASIQTASPYTQVSPKHSPSSRPLSMFDSPTRNYYTQRSSATPKSSCELISPATCSTPSTISNTTPRRVSAFPAPPAPIMIPGRSRSLRRRSMGALDHDLARGAPRHPPPSVPLPKVPSPVVESGSLGAPAAAMGLSQSMPRSTGEHWGAMEERRKRRKSRQAAVVEHVGLGITLDDAVRAAEERSARRSFCDV